MSENKTAQPEQNMKAQEVETLVVDGKVYSVNDMDDNTKQMIGIYRKWDGELVDARLEVYKIEAAQQTLTNQIQTAITDIEPIGDAPAEQTDSAE